MRLTARWPSIASIVPFIPLFVLVDGDGAASFPARVPARTGDVVRSFGELVYKGILPEYLQDSLVRLAVGPSGASRWAFRLASWWA